MVVIKLSLVFLRLKKGKEDRNIDKEVNKTNINRQKGESLRGENCRCLSLWLSNTYSNRQTFTERQERRRNKTKTGQTMQGTDRQTNR